MALVIPLKVKASPQTVRLAVETPIRQVGGDYAQLSGLPKINGHTLLGDQSAAQLGLATPSQIPSVPGDIGAIAAPAGPTNGQYLCWNGSAWVAASLPLYNGGVS